MNRPSGVLVVLVASLVGTHALSHTETLLRDTLNAIDAALDFFDKESNNLNLDAVIGTRIVEG